MATHPEGPDDFRDPLLEGEDGEPGRDGRGSVTEFFRKAAVASLGALFMTEEGVRSLAGQLKLPKEVLGFVVALAEKTKDDVGRVISEEVRRFLQSEKLREEFVKLLSGMSLEVKAQIRLVPDPSSEGQPKPGTALHPELSVTEISARRGKKKKD